MEKIIVEVDASPSTLEAIIEAIEAMLGILPEPGVVTLVGAGMTLSERLSGALEMLPEASLGEDNDGQLVVYTNLRENAEGELVPFE